MTTCKRQALSDSTKSKAIRFKRENNLTELSYESLSHALSSLGYTVTEYDKASNNDSVNVLITVHSLEQYTSTGQSFTFVDSFNKLIFLNGSGSDKEKLIALAHETGHIICGHSPTNNIIGIDVANNVEADRFAGYLLGLGTGGINKRILAIVAAVIVCAIIGGVIYWLNSYYGEYYVTEFGEKYHLKDCMYVKNAEHPRRFTMADYYSGKYEPCQVCEPEKEREQL